MTIRNTISMTLLALTVIAAGTASFAQANTRGDAGNYSENAPGGGDDRGASDLAGADGGRDTQGVIDDSDEQLDVWVQRCNDAGGGMSTDETGNYTCTGSDGNEIRDY
jgi:hypothetical protein